MIPNYLKGYEKEYAVNKKSANLAWWKKAKMGMFIHYGLYSRLGRGEWAQYNEQITVSKYARLKDHFNPNKFNADFITDLACEAEMKYLNLVTCHHEGFPLWNSRYEPFNSYNACGRDLLFELKEQCDKKGLGFFTYFTFMLNWRHPHHVSNEILEIARPHYKYRQPEYLTEDIESYKRYYYKWVKTLMTELLTMYGDITGMWLDIIMGYYLRPDLVPYNMVKELMKKYQPGALLSFKQGADGTEDFATPEHSFKSLKEQVMNRTDDVEAGNRAQKAWNKNKKKHNEICVPLQDTTWGYDKSARHKTTSNLVKLLGYAGYNKCNLLLNTGPLGDGSLHSEDVTALRGLGKHIRKYGWPEPKL